MLGTSRAIRAPHLKVLLKGHVAYIRGIDNVRQFKTLQRLAVARGGPASKEHKVGNDLALQSAGIMKKSRQKRKNSSCRLLQKSQAGREPTSDGNSWSRNSSFPFTIKG
jgi:hypothetical protein